MYRVIRKSLRNFRTRLRNNQDKHSRKSISIVREWLQDFLCTRRRGVLAGFTARGQSWRNMAWTGNKKAFCVLEFAKTELIVTVQRRFRTMYHTEPPTDKTIREWYMKFQQSGCLCAAKRTGWTGPSAETVERVRETFVRSPQKSTHRASRELQMPQTSSRERIPAAAVAGAESPRSQSSFTLLRGFPTEARGRLVCWDSGFQRRGDVSCVW